MSDERLYKRPCRERGCAWCLPRPNLPTDKGPVESPGVPGYSTTDPDGHTWFTVSTRWAGEMGENLAFRVPPDDLEVAQSTTWSKDGRIYHYWRTKGCTHGT